MIQEFSCFSFIQIKFAAIATTHATRDIITDNYFNRHDRRRPSAIGTPTLCFAFAQLNSSTRTTGCNGHGYAMVKGTSTTLIKKNPTEFQFNLILALFTPCCTVVCTFLSFAFRIWCSACTVWRLWSVGVSARGYLVPEISQTILNGILLVPGTILWRQYLPSTSTGHQFPFGGFCSDWNRIEIGPNPERITVERELIKTDAKKLPQIWRRAIRSLATFTTT